MGPSQLGKTRERHPSSASASDSSESSTESSTTSDDEDSEVTFNTIKRRQTKIHVIAPKPPPSSSPAKSDNSVASLVAETSFAAGTDTSPNQCDETRSVVNSNGDNDCKVKAVNDCFSGDVNDNTNMDTIRYLATYRHQ